MRARYLPAPANASGGPRELYIRTRWGVALAYVCTDASCAVPRSVEPFPARGSTLCPWVSDCCATWATKFGYSKQSEWKSGDWRCEKSRSNRPPASEKRGESSPWNRKPKTGVQSGQKRSPSKERQLERAPFRVSKDSSLARRGILFRWVQVYFYPQSIASLH